VFTLLWILAVVLVIAGIVTAMRGQLVLGITHSGAGLKEPPAAIY
jgi:hypothetical protein